MTGYRRDEVLDRNCRFLQGPDTDRGAVRELARAIAARENVATEIVNYRKDGTPFWNALFVSPIYDAGGTLVYFFASQLDVSRRRDAEEALGQRHDQHEQPAPLRPLVGGDEMRREHHGDDQPGEEHHRVGVEPRDRPRVEAEPGGRVRVAGVRPRAGDDRAEDEDEGTDGAGERRGPPDQRRDERRELTGGFGGTAPEVGGHRDEDRRYEEVGGDRRRVQPEEHRQTPEHRLDEDPHEDGPRGRCDVPPPIGGPVGSHHGEQCHDTEHPRQGPVPELDVLVEPLGLLVGRGVRPGHALRPRGAAQAAAGDPDQTTGHDDPELRDEVRQEHPGSPAAGVPRRRRGRCGRCSSGSGHPSRVGPGPDRRPAGGAPQSGRHGSRRRAPRWRPAPR